MVAYPLTAQEYHLPKADGFADLTLQSHPVLAPSAGGVLVKIHAVSLNFLDLAVARGQYAGQKLNIIPCSDMAGEVIAVGDLVRKWAPGDRVCANFSIDHIHGDVNDELRKAFLGFFIDGVLAEYRVFPEHSLVRIPDHLSYQEASTLPCAGVTAWNCLQGPVPVKGGDVVVVQGTGGVSVFGIQLAEAIGATVIATSSSNEKLKVAKELGAHHLINYKETPNWDEEVLKLTNGRGADHIIDIGGAGTLVKSVKAVRFGGWVHCVGFVAAPDAEIASLPSLLTPKAAVLRGILIGPRASFEDLNRLLGARKIKPVIDQVFSFDKAREGFEYLATRPHIGKVVIQVARG